MFQRLAKTLTGLIGAGLVVAGCAGVSLPELGGGDTKPISTETNTPPNRDTVGLTTKPSAPGDAYAVATANVSTVYSRIAGGLNRCWLRPGQALGPRHRLHAKVAPPPTTSAVLAVHVKNAAGRPGLKVYSVDMTAVGVQTRVIANNVKLPPDHAVKMASDVERWTRGEQACEPEAGWAAQSTSPETRKQTIKVSRNPASLDNTDR